MSGYVWIDNENRMTSASSLFDAMQAVCEAAEAYVYLRTRYKLKIDGSIRVENKERDLLDNLKSALDKYLYPSIGLKR